METLKTELNEPEDWAVEVKWESATSESTVDPNVNEVQSV